MVLAPVLVPELLLPALAIYLGDISSFHFISGFLCLLLQLLLVLLLAFHTPLLILLLLGLHEFLKHMRLLQFICSDLLL